MDQFMSEKVSDLDDKALARKREVTSLFLGLFSVSPVLYVFQAWTFLPALALCGLALWKAYQLAQEGIKAVLLTTCSWIMVFFTVNIFLMYSPLDPYIKESIMDSRFWDVLGFISSVAIFTLLLFAILAVRNGIKAKGSKKGIILALIHFAGWLVIIVLAVLWSMSGVTA